MPLFDDTRTDWQARPPVRALTRVPRYARIGVSWHWLGDGHGPASSHLRCLEQVRAWQHQHMTGPMRAKDIGYTGLVCRHARAIEGRGIDYAGAHSPGVNDTHLGFQFMVGAADDGPTPAMYARAAQLRAAALEVCPNLRRDWAHRDDPEAATECPGNTLAAWVHAGGPTTPTPHPGEDEMTPEQRADLVRDIVNGVLWAPTFPEESAYDVGSVRNALGVTALTVKALTAQVGALTGALEKVAEGADVDAVIAGAKAGAEAALAGMIDGARVELVVEEAAQ